MPRTPTAVPLLSGPRVVDSVVPLYVAHRCGQSIYPEASGEAALGSVTDQVKALEWDNWQTVDDSTLVMHDSTVPRTTDGAGNSVDQTKESIATMRLDTSSWFGSSKFGDLRVPVCEDMLRVGAGRALMFPEAKNADAVQAIVDLALRMGLEDSVVVQAGVQADLAPAVAAGIDAMILSANAGSSIASIQANGIEWVGSDIALAPAANIDAYLAAGLKVAMYTVNRRSERDIWTPHNVTAMFSDDPVYVSGADIRLKSDPFALQTWFFGMIKSSTGSRGVFLTPDWWGFTSNGKSFVYMGWMSDAVPATTYTFKMKWRYDAIPAGAETSWLAIFDCAPDDREYLDTGAATENGYNAILRANGQMQIFKRVNGASTTLGTSSGGSDTPITAGGIVTVEWTVTPTQLTIKRTDTGQTLTVSDNTHRGGHRHLGHNAALNGFHGSQQVTSCPRP